MAGILIELHERVSAHVRERYEAAAAAHDAGHILTDEQVRDVLRTRYTSEQAAEYGFIAYGGLSGWQLTNEGRARAIQLLPKPRTYQNEFGRVVNVDATPRDEGR